MTELRRPKGAVSLGDAVPMGISSGRAPCARHCARCGARLRHHNHTTLCAPCHDALWPWTPPTLRTSPTELQRRRHAWHEYQGLICPECGARKSQGAKTCLRCYLAAVANKDPWDGPVCPTCGGHKAIDARMCHECRYPKLRT